MKISHNRDLVEDLFFPTLLFAALGGMTWAVRGCSGFGGSAGCIFAGVMWGAAWWFIARDPGPEPSRRYTSPWIVLAVTAGLGISGAGMDAMAELLRRQAADKLRGRRVRPHFESVRLPVAVHRRHALGRHRCLPSGLVRVAA